MSSHDKPAAERAGVEVIEQRVELTLTELCRYGGADEHVVVELVAHGLIDPVGGGLTPWRFTGSTLTVIRRASRLMHDLGLNAAGAAVAIELLDRIERLERHLWH